MVRADNAWLQCRSLKPTWHGVHGPLGAVIMSLRRIDWSLEIGGLRHAATPMNSSTCCRHHRDVWRHWLSVGSHDVRCVTLLVLWLLIQVPPTYGFVTCFTCCIHRKAWVSLRKSTCISPWSREPHMPKSDDCAEPPNRPVVLLLSRHVCSSVVRMSRNVSHCIALRARTDSFPSAGCLGY